VWVKNNSTLTLNQETAPDGTETAAKYLGSGTGQDLYYNIDLNGPFTFSFFVKYINAPYVRLRTGNVSTWFNLTTGNIATQNHDSATIQDVGDGWFRVSGTTTSTSSFSHFYIHPHATDNTTFEQDGGSFYVWGPQVEEGTTASDFVENTTGSPKFITGATYGPRVPMILVEPSATNLVEYSEDFSEWNIGDTQPLLNQITSPDGSTNAAKLNALNTSNQGYISNNIPVTASTTYTFSTYAKKGEQKFVCLVGLNPFTESYFDLESGTALSNNATSSSIEDVGNGWFRLSATFDAQTSTKFAGIYLSQTGNSLVASSIPNGEGVYIWGAQLETGSVATSYIPNPAPISSTLNSVTSFEADGSVGGFNNIHVESIAGISGKEVEVEFEIFDYVSGTAACLMGFAFTPSIQVGGSLNANGIYRGVVTADSNNRILFRNNSNTDNFTGKIRNIKVVEVDTSGARAADDLVISGSAFTDFFNATEGTTYVETAPKTTTNIPHIFEYHNSSDANANRMGIYLPSVSLNAFVRSSGVTTASLTVGNINLNQLNRVAISYKVNDILGSLNGASEVSDTSAAIPSGIDKLHIGNVYNFNFPLNGHIKRLIYWPYHSDSL
jgi:hypothetical protein